MQDHTLLVCWATDAVHADAVYVDVVHVDVFM